MSYPIHGLFLDGEQMHRWSHSLPMWIGRTPGPDLSKGNSPGDETRTSKPMAQAEALTGCFHLGNDVFLSLVSRTLSNALGGVMVFR